MATGRIKWERWVASLALASSCVTGGLVLGGVPNATAVAPPQGETVSSAQSDTRDSDATGPYTPGTYQEWRRKYGKPKPAHPVVRNQAAPDEMSKPSATGTPSSPKPDAKASEAMATLRGEAHAPPKKKWRWWNKDSDAKTDKHSAAAAAPAAPVAPVASATRQANADPTPALSPETSAPSPATPVASATPAPVAVPVVENFAPSPSVVVDVTTAVAATVQVAEPPAPAPALTPAPALAAVEPEAEAVPSVAETKGQMVEIKGPSRPVSTSPPSVEMRRRHGSRPNPSAVIQPAHYHTTRPTGDGAATIPANVAAKYRSPYANWKKTGPAKEE